MQKRFEQWQDDWRVVFLLAMVLALGVLVPFMIAMPYVLVREAFGNEDWPHWWWAMAISYVVFGPHWTRKAHDVMLRERD